MAETKEEKAQQKAVEESALDSENPAYVGVSDEYKNHAYVALEPMATSGKDTPEVEKRAVEAAEANSSETFGLTPVHPSEREPRSVPGASK
jgi:hypothetical protein